MKTLTGLLTRIAKKISFIHPEKPVGLYRIEVTSLPEELDFPEILPLELQYVLAKSPHCRERLRDFLAHGKAVGIRTVERTPENVLAAINHVSLLSQHFLILSWLPALLRTHQFPVITAADKEKARARGVDLDKEVAVVYSQRREFKKVVLIDEENRGTSAEELQLMRELNEDLDEISIDYIINRLTFDNAHERTETAQSVVKALLLVGPIAHILEQGLHGLGKVFAASTDDLMSEAAELLALRGSGFSWKVLWKRSLVLLPVFLAATYLAFSSERFVEVKNYFTAGLLFGVSAVALSLTTAIQSIFMYRSCVRSLIQEGKLPAMAGGGIMQLALRQDFTNPARLGLFLGAAVAPINAMLAFNLFPNWLHNGWFLALLGSTEGLVAGLTVLTARKINNFIYRRNLKRVINPD